MVWFFQAVSGVVQALFKIWRQCTKQVKSCYKDGYYVVIWTNGYKPHKSLSDFLEPQLSEQNEQDAEDTPFKSIINATWRHGHVFFFRQYTPVA